MENQDYTNYLEYQKSMTKYLTKEEFNKLSDGDLDRVIVASNDGQGDTYLRSFLDIASYYDESIRNIRILDDLFEMGGNLVKLGWIENNKLLKLIVK
jgi:hypothetical protein